MIVIDDFPQLSPDWFKAHAGIPGAASFDNIITNATAKKSTSQHSYKCQLISETLLGAKENNEWKTTAATEEGVKREDESRKAFELIQRTEVHQVAMCFKDEHRRFLCSPDGLLKHDGKWVAGLELKNPLAKTHVSYFLGDKLPTKYIAQVQGSLYITGLPVWYFMSYYPGLEPFIKKIYPDKKYHEKLEAMLVDFCMDLMTMRKRISRD